ncbi:MAG: xanthan lyase, partial [Proteiniphilum sp.]|nr:xanthan lyase [Proteiniphilum sp.]
KRKVPLKARETKNLVSVWDEAPRSININTLISANLPGAINLPVNNIIRERNKPIDEEGDYVVENATYEIPGEVIVDNEDSTLFLLSAPEVVGLLPQWLDRVDENSFRYSGVSNWRPPLQWTLTTNDKYHGTHIRSAYVIKSGSGNQTATWKIPVSDAGQYDLFYWVYKPDELRRGRRRGGRGSAGGDAEYHFKVRYDGYEENAYINLQRSEEGWSELGTYFFNNDTVVVVLSNDAKLRTVTADAVKIVRR